MRNFLLISFLTVLSFTLVHCGPSDEDTADDKTAAEGAAEGAAAAAGDKKAEEAKAEVKADASVSTPSTAGSYNVSFGEESGKAWIVHSDDKKSQTIVSVSIDGWPKSLCTLYEGDNMGNSNEKVKGYVSIEKKGEALSLKGQDGKMTALTLTEGGFPPSFASLKSTCGL